MQHPAFPSFTDKLCHELLTVLDFFAINIFTPRPILNFAIRTQDTTLNSAK